MGAKTALLAYSDDDIAEGLRRSHPGRKEDSDALIMRLYPGWKIEEVEGASLGDSTYPPYGTTYAASFPGVDLICDQRVMIDLPSELPAHLVEAGTGRRMVLHAMHSVVDWLAFGVWENGRLLRSLSLSPDGGIEEDIGEPLPFETPYWAGERPVDKDPVTAEERYPLSFHPLELGEEALRSLFGFVIEDRPEPGDVDAYGIRLKGYRLTDPANPDEVTHHDADLREATTAMRPQRFGIGPDGSLIEIEPPAP